MSGWGWKFFGKRAVDCFVEGKRRLGYSNEDIVALMEKDKLWDERQLNYVKKKLGVLESGAKR